MQRFLEVDSLDAPQRPSQKFIGFRFNGGSYAGIGWSPMRRIVFEASVVGRIVRRRDYDTVGEPRLSSVIVKQDRMGDGRGWSVGGAFGEHYFDVVCRKHFQRTRKCGLGQSMGIHPKKKRTVNVLDFAVITNRLSDCQDVPLVKRRVQSRSAMAGCTEDNPLSRVTRIGPQLVVGCKEFRNIHQDRGISGLPRCRTDFHLPPHQGFLLAAGKPLQNSSLTMTRTFTDRSKRESLNFHDGYPSVKRIALDRGSTRKLICPCMEGSFPVS